MERLTVKTEKGYRLISEEMCDGDDLVFSAINRLAELEDKLESGEIVEKQEEKKPVFKIEFSEREIEVLLNNLQSQININVGILFDNTYAPAGEEFCVMLEALNETQNIYVNLKALLPPEVTR